MNAYVSLSLCLIQIIGYRYSFLSTRCPLSSICICYKHLRSAMDWTVSLLNSYVKALTPPCDCVRKWGLWELIRLWTWSPCDWDQCPRGRDTWERWSLFLPHEDTVRRGPCSNHSGREVSPPRTWSRGHPSSLRAGRNVSCLSRLSPWYLLVEKPELIKTLGKWWIVSEYLESHIWKKG